MKKVALISGLIAICATHGFSAEILKFDFEGDKPTAGWSIPKGWSVVEKAGRKGSHGLVWENNDPAHYSFPVHKVPLEPGSAYRFGAWVKCEDPKLRPYVSIDFSDANGKWIGSHNARPMISNEPDTDGWIRYEGISKPLPANTARGNLLCYLPRKSVGKVYFDEFTFTTQATSPIEFLQCSAYQNTFWQGEVKFAAALHINTVKNPLDTLEVKLHFRRSDGSEVDLPVAKFDAESAYVAIKAEECAMGSQDVALRIIAGKVKIAEAKCRVTRTEAPVQRKVSIDSRGRTIVDGKPFFPLGMFIRVPTDEVLAEYTKGPFNFVMQYGQITKEHLDRWQKNGIYVATDVRSLIYGYNYSAKSKYRTIEESKAAFRAKLEEIGGHPALLAWYLVDEAPIEFVPNVSKMNEYLHEIDPNHPTYAVTDKPWDVRSLLPCYDVLGMDPYPIGNHGGRSKLAICSEWVESARQSMFDFRPMWHVPQTFSWGWYRRDEVGLPNVRMPTRDEIANMTWQGIAAGANGICSYAFHAMQRELKGEEFKKEWANVCEVAAEIKAKEDILLSDETPLIVKNIPAELVVRAYRKDGKDWLLIVNRSNAKVKATLTLPESQFAVELDYLGYKFVAVEPQK